MKKGLIVSIQGYSLTTAQELAENAIMGGAEAIRTDQPIKITVPVIGLEKNNKEYYITTTRESINNVMRWADYIGIDCRQGNPDLEILLAQCHVNNLKVVADIESLEDVIYLITFCKSANIKAPDYISTTFHYGNPYGNKIKSIAEIKRKFPDIKLIAEGGYSHKDDLCKILEYCENICIGNSISNIQKLTFDVKNKLMIGAHNGQ